LGVLVALVLVIGLFEHWLGGMTLRAGVGLGTGIILFLALVPLSRRIWPPRPPDALYPRAWPLVLAGAVAGLLAAIIGGGALGRSSFLGVIAGAGYATLLWLEKRAPVGPAA
jgi:hypothetical protein